MVALRKESVDRNLSFLLVAGSLITSLSARRAWIEIVRRGGDGGFIAQSLSARRAWIEICCLQGFLSAMLQSLSARRAWIEMPRFRQLRAMALSLSARRAWIEIRSATITLASSSVALRKESVDRNPSRTPT